MKHVLITALMSASIITGCSQPAQQTDSDTATQDKDTSVWPRLDVTMPNEEAVQKRVASILSGMTLEQKVAQVIQPEIRDITVEDMRQYGFGSYLNGGGAFPDNNKHATPEEWVALAEAMYQASVDDSLDGSNIPTMWGTDAVHGHNNVIGATLFPHNIGLGAMRNPALIKEIAKATAKEVQATGIDWIFAPTVAVARDDRWGRTYESYSEHPQVVHDYAEAIVTGLQGELDGEFLSDKQVISTVKHFIGDGGTERGDDQGNNLASEQELFDVHAQGYVAGIKAGTQSVMASFNSWHGDKIHGSKYLLTDVLKDRMGFQGFVVGDWNGHGQISGCSNEDCPQAMNAGLDVYMVPTQAWKPLYNNLITQVKEGVIPQSRLDDAVTRVLAVKVRAGLFDNPSPANRPYSAKKELIGHPDHRSIARQAVQESLVLLKNNDQLLPLNPTQRILLAGDGADNIGKQSGGWTITWQGTGNTNADFPGATSIYGGFEQLVEAEGGSVELAVDGNYTTKPDVAVVVFGEEPYAEGNGDLDNLEYQRGNKTDLALLKKLQSDGIPVVSVFLSGRPLWVNAELNASDAFVAAWLPGSEGQGVADVLLANADGSVRNDITGKLPFSWPATPVQATVNIGDKDYAPLLPFDYGLSFSEPSELSDSLPETFAIEAQAAQQVALFDRSAKAPWKVGIAANNGTTWMSSNTLEDSGLSVRTTDRRVQEDTLLLTWQPDSNARFGLYTPFPEDMRGIAEQQPVLRFDYALPQADSATLTLSMDCEGECGSSVQITLSGSDSNWQTMAIPLQCFTDKGLNPAKVMAAFEVSLPAEANATAPVSVKVSDIFLDTQVENTPDCP